MHVFDIPLSELKSYQQKANHTLNYPIKFLGVHEGLIRVSIGLEDTEVIAEDFLQTAFKL